MKAGTEGVKAGSRGVKAGAGGAKAGSRNVKAGAGGAQVSLHVCLARWEW